MDPPVAAASGGGRVRPTSRLVQGQRRIHPSLGCMGNCLGLMENC